VVLENHRPFSQFSRDRRQIVRGRLKRNRLAWSVLSVDRGLDKAASSMDLPDQIAVPRSLNVCEL
jgi:hypothetical protein